VRETREDFLVSDVGLFMGLCIDRAILALFGGVVISTASTVATDVITVNKQGLSALFPWVSVCNE
jgi:predicted MFS family arabinose efflux permease